MFCPNCGNNCGDANFCSNCGHQMKRAVVMASTVDEVSGESTEIVRICEKYRVDRNKISAIAALRKITGMGLAEAEQTIDDYVGEEPTISQSVMTRTQKKAELNKSGQVYCPKCLSTSISANQKGFGFARGAIGAAVGLDVGLIAGGIGSKKVICTCLKCGYQWKAGKK